MDELVARLEVDLAHVGESDDPIAVRFRAHGQPLVDAARGLVVLSPEELAEHTAAVHEIYIELGAAASTVLSNVEAIITEGMQTSRRRQFGGDDLEGKA